MLWEDKGHGWRREEEDLWPEMTVWKREQEKRLRERREEDEARRLAENAARREAWFARKEEEARPPPEPPGAFEDRLDGIIRPKKALK